MEVPKYTFSDKFKIVNSGGVHVYNRYNLLYLNDNTILLKG